MGPIILQALTAHSLLEGHVLELYERHVESSSTYICYFCCLHTYLM
jgi:hypothetical protein